MKVKDTFLDAASNTFLDKKVFSEMEPFMREDFFGNSKSAHAFGVEASMAIEEAREEISHCLGFKKQEIIFTSGASEGNNCVIKALAYRELCKKPKKLQKKHIVCGATEHNSVLKPLQQLQKLGFKVTFVKPNSKGVVTADSVKEAITEDTFLLCLMAINNELGTLNETSEASYFAASHGVKTLVDCTQLLSYGSDSLHLPQQFPSADFFTFSAHKIYGPVGVGVLAVKEDSLPLLQGNSLILGGSQEGGIRGGTSNTAGIVGAAKAVSEMELLDLKEHYENLYRYTLNQLDTKIGHLNYKLNAIPFHKNIMSLCFYPYLNENSLASTLSLYEIAVSAGSACDAEHDETAGAFNPSHVLKSLDLTEPEIRNTIRISFDKKTSTKSIDKLVTALQEIKEGLIVVEGAKEDD